jgi:O-antigen ligase
MLSSTQDPHDIPQGRILHPTGLDRCTFVLLWCFVFSVPFERALMAGDLTVSRIVGFLLLPCAVLAIIARGWVKPLLPAHSLMLMFLAWAGASCLWSASPDATSLFSTEVQCILVVVLIWQFSNDQQRLWQLVEAYVLGTFISCASTMFRFFDHRSTDWQRYAAAGFDPNDLSLTLALSIPLAYFLFLRSKAPWLWCWLFQIGMALMTCLLTASRMGAVVSVLALSVVGLTARTLSKKQVAVLSMVGVAAIFAVTTMIPQTSWNRVFTISDEVTSGNLNDRTLIWAAGVQVFSSHPVAGVGLGAFPESTAPLLSFPSDEAFVAHNTFISIGTELGLIGLSLFLALLAAIVMPVLRLPAIECRILLLTFILWAVGASTLTWEEHKSTWILFALMIQAGSTVARSPAFGRRRIAVTPANAHD